MIPSKSASQEEAMILLTEEVEQVGHAADAFRGMLILYARELVTVLERCGFDRIKVVRADAAPSGPHYAAVRKRQSCYICLQNEVTTSEGLLPISSEQCDACDAMNVRRDVYYAALVEEGGKLYLYPPVRLRSKGKWLVKNKELRQYFGPDKCHRLTRFRALLGGFSEYKLEQVYVPRVRDDGQVAATHIRGLGRLREPPLALMYRMSIPHLCLLTKRVDENQPEVIQTFFYYDHQTHSELELIQRVGADATCGWVKLMTERGSVLYAESVDAAALPTKLHMPLRYTWSFSMVAEQIKALPYHLTADSGAFYEFIREEYQREHGVELPPSFVENVTAEGFLHLYQGGERPQTMLVGRIVALVPEKIFALMHTVATVKVTESGDDILLKLIISPELLGDYAPDVGDIICSCGILQAVPEAVVQSGEIWRTSPATGGRNRAGLGRDGAREIYERMAPYSIGAAVAAAAFTAADWMIESDAEQEDFVRDVPAIIAMNRVGRYMVVMQDTIINGHEPRFPLIGYEDAMKSYMRTNYERDTLVCHVNVMLDFVPEYNHYRVGMKVEPHIPGVRNRILAAICPLRDRNPFLPREIDLLRPRKLDEARAAELMYQTFERGKWRDLAPWLREELEYTTETSRVVRYVGKVDFLRYICERVAVWKTNGAWERLSYSIGSVPVNGAQRPAFALHDEGKVVNLTIFGNSYGMIGSMHSLPPSFFPLYEAKKTGLPRIN